MADKGELEPWTLTVKRTMANWKRQLLAGLPEAVTARWRDETAKGNRPTGPVDACKRLLKDIGWRSDGPGVVEDQLGVRRTILQ